MNYVIYSVPTVLQHITVFFHGLTTLVGLDFLCVEVSRSHSLDAHRR